MDINLSIKEELNKLKKNNVERFSYQELLHQFNNVKEVDVALKDFIINEICEIKSLTYLNLSGLGLKKLPSKVNQLTKLKILDLRENRFNSIPQKILQITSLEILDLLGNNLTSLPESISNLSNLKALGLSKNNLKELPSTLCELPLLRHIDLYDNNFNDELYASIYSGLSSLLNYLDDKEKEPIYEGKLLIVGEPNAGKTSLMKKLLNPNYIPALGKTKTTHGINISQWCFKKDQIDFTVNTWDFGGQEIQYSTHQFFLTSNAVYVLVIDNRAQRANLDYWLDVIRLLGKKNTSVILLLHDKENAIINNIDLDTLKLRYCELNIISKRLNLADSNGSNYKSFVNEIKKILLKLPHIGSMRSKKWGMVKDEVIKLRQLKNYLSLKEFIGICAMFDVNEMQIDSLRSSLTSLGVIVSFEETELKDFIVINPQWAVDPLYSVLAEDNVKLANGYFDRAFFYRQLKSLPNKYTDVEINILLSLLTRDHFEICLCIDKNEPIENQRFIVPQLLEESALALDEKYHYLLNERPFTLEYHYPFLPKGLFSKMVVRQDEHILFCKKINKPLVWRNGMILKKNDAVAFLSVENNSDKNFGSITIKTYGLPRDKNHLMNLLRENFRKLHSDFSNNLNVEEFVPCICTICNKDKEPYLFKNAEIENNLKNGKYTIECRKSSEDIQVKKLIEGVIGESHYTKPRTYLSIRDIEDRVSSIGGTKEEQDSLIEKVRLYSSHYTDLSKLFDFVDTASERKTYFDVVDFIEKEMRFIIPERVGTPPDNLAYLLELAIQGLSNINQSNYVSINQSTDVTNNIQINIQIKNDICFQLEGLLDGLEKDCRSPQLSEKESLDLVSSVRKAKEFTEKIEASENPTEVNKNLNKLKTFVRNIKKTVSDANSSLNGIVTASDKVEKIYEKVSKLIDLFQNLPV